MKIKFSAFADLKEIVGQKHMEFELEDGATVGDFLAFLLKRYGKPMERFLLKSAGGYWPFLLLVNQQDVRPDNYQKKLHEGDEIIILFPAEGG
ncbi:MoaD/ThiS family protein [Neomoorella mulderi]|uniref:ThiS family protein n=1 Tax=Moorella mulderi DSM 14980 TaxID=1122241 RepID=A0A151AVV0_9FIRM|nr:MoaD/ThiS family protein [Moorella mulderi]KYH31794.1 ThiS family protein [Moorella mulderi DSM 14980]